MAQADDPGKRATVPFRNSSQFVGGDHGQRAAVLKPRRARWAHAAKWTLAVGTLICGALFWVRAPGAQQPAPNPPAQAVTPGQAAPAGQAPSGQTAPPTSGSIIRGVVNVVNVPVSVIGKNGVPVIDMKKDEFQVFEDGREQTIKYFTFGARGRRFRIGLILDTSNSARRHFQFVKDAAQEFIFQMLQGRSSKNQIFLQTFDATSSILQDFTNDPEMLNEKIMSLKAAEAAKLFTTPSTRRAGRRCSSWVRLRSLAAFWWW